ncbi:MAG: ATP-binding protein [Candidatus Thiodiazotropha sp.]
MERRSPYLQRLAWLDLLLHREILRLRARYQLSLDEFRGLYVSDRQVDDLLRDNLGEVDPDTLASLARKAELEFRLCRDGDGEENAWQRLITAGGLSTTEEKVLLLALAPELDTKYETLYAYLNNDVSRKRPTHDLALRLFGEGERQRRELRQALLPRNTLYGKGLLRPPSAASEELAWLGQGFALTPLVADYLLGLPGGGRLPDYVRFETAVAVVGESRMAETLQRLPQLLTTSPQEQIPWLLLQGAAGSGRREGARTIAQRLNLPLLEIDLALALQDGSFVEGLREILLLQRLTGALLFISPLERLFERDGEPSTIAFRLIAELQAASPRICFSGTPGLVWGRLLPAGKLLAFELEPPDPSARHRLWRQQLEQRGLSVEPSRLQTVAERFQLTPGQISEAAEWSARMRLLRGGNGDGRVDDELLFEAARNRSSAQLGRLAVKLPQSYSWQDLVLPPVVLQQVEELASAISHRHRVYEEWGLGRRFGGAGGLKVLFSGASGTGKTMTASVLAGELGLELFRIDLSGIVSKYIGETEKNLDQIFRTAHASNAILFFDEADALFGKRSEVKDAHDRYANIEVAYLLQKMEEYDGVVILASNLSKNIDQAFSRRMHYVVEFPLPDEAHRQRLWRGMLPPELPLDGDVDLAFLARQFRLAGGDIKNIVLSAAFLSAREGTPVGMQSLLQATARQLIKQGKMPSANEFKHYYPLLAQVSR